MIGAVSALRNLLRIWPFWVVPLGLYLGLLTWLAWKVASTPHNPFVYRL